jgi:hypothetical protein
LFSEFDVNDVFDPFILRMLDTDFEYKLLVVFKRSISESCLLELDNADKDLLAATAAAAAIADEELALLGVRLVDVEEGEVALEPDSVVVPLDTVTMLATSFSNSLSLDAITDSSTRNSRKTMATLGNRMANSFSLIMERSSLSCRVYVCDTRMVCASNSRIKSDLS